MVKSGYKKEESELSTSHSYCESDLTTPETLSTIIAQLPKMTQAERRQTCRSTLRFNPAQAASRKWSHAETAQFYHSLRHYGLDFTLMSYHADFAGRRTQKELSNKYKKEARMNPGRVESVLKSIDEEGLFGTRQHGRI